MGRSFSHSSRHVSRDRAAVEFRNTLRKSSETLEVVPDFFAEPDDRPRYLEPLLDLVVVVNWNEPCATEKYPLLELST